MVSGPYPPAPWGKTAGGASHHLAHHCADAAACFEVIVGLPCVRAALARAAGRPLDDVDLSRLAMLTFQHDAGKLHPGFQAKGWADAPGIPRHGHAGEGAAIFQGVAEWRIARNLCCETMSTWGDGDTLVNLFYTVFAHHGRPVCIEPVHINGWKDGLKAGYDPIAASAEIGELLPGWFAPAFMPGGAPLPNAPEFQHLFCGLVALADWLASDRSLFAFSAELDSCYMDKARAKARRAVRAIGLDVAPWRRHLTSVAPAFASLAPGRTPRAGQQAVGTWPLDDLLVILEAETGSGKTEAALWRFARLFAAGKVDGLYFAVPTRAAAKQLHARVHAAVQSLFGEDAPQVVLAVPGYLRAGEHEGQALPHFDVLWDDAPDEAQRLARWAAENARRFLAAPVAVGTVDQAMLAGLQVKHAHLRGAALSRSLLVIDEVHASDNYMTAIQTHLLDLHLARGGFAMLMSATLGAAARVKWLGGKRARVPPVQESVATPYPAVWGKTTPMQAVAVDGRQKRVVMRLVSSWSAEDAAHEAMAAAQAGARVLVIRNTVGMAVATFEAVRQAGGEGLLWHVAGTAALHHSRFAIEDRKLLDDAVEAALSPDSRVRPSAGVIVIGTQTLEQSLDICADFLITDLCPADVLLQRIGRLHRHDLPRPAGFEAPQCMVLSPEGGLDDFAAPKFENGLGMFKDGGGVYRNLHACELTRRMVEAHPQWVIPDMNRFIVESATHPERIDALNEEKGPGWAGYWNGVYGQDLADAQAGRSVLLDVSVPFSECGFSGGEEKIRTRLGAEGVRIDFVPGTMGPFGGEITTIICPAHWKGIVPEGPVTPERDEDGTLRFSVGDKNFWYQKIGLEII